MKSLAYLDLSCNQFSAGTPLHHLTRLTCLRRLDLDSNRIQTSDLYKLSPLSSTLQRLSLEASAENINVESEVVYKCNQPTTWTVSCKCALY